MTTTQTPRDANEGTMGTSRSTAGLERKRFHELCDLLPADVNWFDPITPQIVREIVIAIETREREACANWLRRNANAEKDPAKRAAFIEAHNAILARSNAELSGPRPLAAEGSLSNDVLGAKRPGKD